MYISQSFYVHVFIYHKILILHNVMHAIFKISPEDNLTSTYFVGQHLRMPSCLCSKEVIHLESTLGIVVVSSRKNIKIYFEAFRKTIENLV